MGKHTRRTYPDLETYFNESGDTQKEFAKRLNRSQPWVSRVKNGRQEPTIAEALEISRRTGVPLESLIAKPKIVVGAA